MRQLLAKKHRKTKTNIYLEINENPYEMVTTVFNRKIKKKFQVCMHLVK